MKEHIEFSTPAQDFKFSLDQLVNIRFSDEWGVGKGTFSACKR